MSSSQGTKMKPVILPSASDVDSAVRASVKKDIRRRLTVRTPAGGRSETWVTVRHEVDPKQAILDKIGHLPEGIVHHSRIIVAVYQPPIVERTQGGLYLGQKIQDEDRLEHLYQGKTGLVVAMGSRAYVDDDQVKFHGVKVEIGDWVWFRPSDGVACDLNEVFCRVFESERYIFGKLPHPDMAS